MNKQSIIEQLNKIDVSYEKRPNFQFINYTLEEEDEVETEWIVLDLESAQELINWLRTKFPTLK